MPIDPKTPTDPTMPAGAKPPANAKPPAKPKSRFNRRTIIIGAIALLIICGGISSLFTNNDAANDSEPTAEVAEQVATDEPTDEPAPTERPTRTPRPAATAEPTVAPSPTETLPALPTLEKQRELTPAELVLRDALDQALGESNRGLGRKLNLFTPTLPEFGNSIIIGWSADDAASPALIREAMARDTLTVLQAVADSGIDYDDVFIGAKYPMMIEQLNLVDEVEILTLQYSRDTLAATDWDVITPEEIFGIADLFIIYPDFEQ